MTQYTQGEWTVVERVSLNQKVSADAKNRFVIQSTAENFPGFIVEIGTCGYKPHAQLFAAAPLMLEALIAVVRVADRKTDEFDMAKRAIAAAKRK